MTLLPLGVFWGPLHSSLPVLFCRPIFSREHMSYMQFSQFQSSLCNTLGIYLLGYISFSRVSISIGQFAPWVTNLKTSSIIIFFLILTLSGVDNFKDSPGTPKVLLPVPKNSKTTPKVMKTGIHSCRHIIVACFCHSCLLLNLSSSVQAFCAMWPLKITRISTKGFYSLYSTLWRPFATKNTQDSLTLKYLKYT